MSDNDLSGAFGRPAKNLSDMLAPRPSRRRAEESTEPSPQTDPTAAGSAPTPTVDKPSTVAVRTDLRAVEDVHTLEETGAAGAGADPAAGPPSTPARPNSRTATSARGRGGAVPTRTQPTRARGARTAPEANAPENTSYQVPIYVHPGVVTAASRRRKLEKLTNAEIAMDAIDDVHGRLAALVRERRLQARPESSLFPGRVRRGRLAGGGPTVAAGEPRRVLWSFRATAAELEVIDRLVSECGAEARSELVAIALEESLLR